VNDQTKTRLLVMPDRDGERLDVFLAAATSLSRRAARRVIAEGLVQRNREILRVQSRLVMMGDVIDVHLPESELSVETTPPMITIEPLYEDRWLIVAPKPPGVLSQPAEGQRPGDAPAFDQQVLLSLARRDGQRPFLRLVHRLDRMTSGAMLFARSPDVLPTLSRAWGDGLVERFYLAVIEGHPKSGTFAVDRPIARDYNHRWRFQCADDGRPSRTEIEVLATIDDGLSVVGCRLITGRTHQVRVHLAAAGHPVLGDRLYHSKRADLVQRPLLHATALNLPHPATGEDLRVFCPPPNDLAKFLPEDLDLSNNS
jgi:23S rRNA pseudouridine1911/1915/1917 synthase